MDLFRNAFQRDLSRLHSNRSACYLRERLYPGANLDSFIVVTGRFCNQTYDEFFLKCLYRLICATIGLQKYTFGLDGFFELSQNSSINFNLRWKYIQDFNELQSCLPRLKDEYQNGKYDLKQMFNNESINSTSFFDIHLFHSDYKNNSCIKKRNNNFYAKCLIPAGTLLLVQHAFAYVKSNGDDSDERRLLNAIEKHLIMAPTVAEFNLVRLMPCINQWFENETDADEDDYEFVFDFSFLIKFCFLFLIELIQKLYHGVYLLKLKKKIRFDQNQLLVGGLKHLFSNELRIQNKIQIVFGKIFF
jgi:hypothetical protein